MLNFSRSSREQAAVKTLFWVVCWRECARAMCRRDICAVGSEGRNWIFWVLRHESVKFSHTPPLASREKCRVQKVAESFSNLALTLTWRKEKKSGVCVRMCAIAAEGLFFQSGTNIQRIWPLSSACKLHEHTHTHRLKAFTALDALYMTSAPPPPIFKITPSPWAANRQFQKFTFRGTKCDQRHAQKMQIIIFCASRKS